MLLLETYISTSPGKGIGLFAKTNIPQGTRFWIRDEVFDRVFSQRELESFGKLALEFVKIHGFQEESKNWYLCGDNARFTNHSKSSNTQHHFNDAGILQYCTSSKDIAAGKEILCDYTEICLTCKDGVIFETRL